MSRNPTHTRAKRVTRQAKFIEFECNGELWRTDNIEKIQCDYQRYREEGYWSPTFHSGLFYLPKFRLSARVANKRGRKRKQ